MKPLRTAFIGLGGLIAVAGTAFADEDVVASFKPVHSLVAAVMDGVATPEIIIDGAGSPHTYSLKPSQAHDLEHAKVIVWIGHEMEAFLVKPIETLGAKAKIVTLDESHGLIKLKFREGGPFEKHGHDDHDDHDAAGHDDHDHKDDDHDHKAEADHDDHDDHDHAEKKETGHDDHDDHDHDKHAEKDHDDHKDHAHEEHGHEEHAHGEFDLHLWLDPVNAKAFVHEIEEALVEADPANAATYKANAEKTEAKLDGLVKELQTTLDPVKDQPFIVFHDAYQYFENRFGLKAAGSITVQPEVIPGAERVAEIRAKVKELGATCVFSEPQFEPKLVRVVTEGTSAKTGVLDPLGASLENGPDLYFDLMRNMAKSVRDCLSEAS